MNRFSSQLRFLFGCFLLVIVAGLCWLSMVTQFPLKLQPPPPPPVVAEIPPAPTPVPANVPPPQPEIPAAQSMPKLTLHLGPSTLQVEVAATSDQRERGLMFRSSLGDNDGMIFLMPNIAPATFWMKNTLIPLSIAFLDRSGTVLEVHDMKAMDETITRSDSDQVAYALEMNLHWFSLNGIKPGDKLAPPPSAWGLTASP